MCHFQVCYFSTYMDVFIWLSIQGGPGNPGFPGIPGDPGIKGEKVQTIHACCRCNNVNWSLLWVATTLFWVLYHHRWEKSNPLKAYLFLGWSWSGPAWTSRPSGTTGTVRVTPICGMCSLLHLGSVVKVEHYPFVLLHLSVTLSKMDSNQLSNWMKSKSN